MVAFRFAFYLSACLALVACQTIAPPSNELLGSAALRFADGRPAGTAMLYGHGDEVSISIALSGFSPGEHGVHLHMTGSCEAPDFMSAGGHLNPARRQHGSNNPVGTHLGDLPNAMIGANGAGTISALIAGTRSDLASIIFDSDGTALVVHALPDDYRTDPSGNSGSRLACGSFSRG